jgi:hypothetical protein
MIKPVAGVVMQHQVWANCRLSLRLQQISSKLS